MCGAIREEPCYDPVGYYTCKAADTLDPVHALLLSVAPYGLVHVGTSILSQVHVSNRQGPSDVAVSSNSGGAQSLRVILVRIPSPIDGKSCSEPNEGKVEVGKGDEGHRLSVGSRRIVTRRKLLRGGIPKVVDPSLHQLISGVPSIS
ncbi:hypothetical protein R1flu_015668 [Riccia fluitans]|uniref:Uncharacterized protein n=1 Tax=Riccia fluitans TaxID=41844 RepID=A0ABD1YNG6_9MARC